jgi:hypothetical protein
MDLASSRLRKTGEAMTKKKEVWRAGVHSLQLPPVRGRLIAELMTDVGGGWLEGDTMEGPFIYTEENDWQPPVEGEIYSVRFRTKDYELFIWDMKCLSVRSVGKEGGVLRLLKA